MNGRNKSENGRGLRRRSLSALLAGVLLVSTLPFTSGCETDDSDLAAFRDAAADTVQAGVVTVVTGLIEGLFAATVPGAGDTGDTGTE